MTKQDALNLLGKEVYTYDSNFKIFKVTMDHVHRMNSSYIWVYPSHLKTLDERDAAEYPEHINKLFISLEEAKSKTLSLINEEISELEKAKKYVESLENI
jgi:hypothetical protein